MENIFNSTLKILFITYVCGVHLGVTYVQKCFCDEIKHKNKDLRL